jgi:hypothetical protein
MCVDRSVHRQLISSRLSVHSSQPTKRNRTRSTETIQPEAPSPPTADRHFAPFQLRWATPLPGPPMTVGATRYQHNTTRRTHNATTETTTWRKRRHETTATATRPTFTRQRDRAPVTMASPEGLDRGPNAYEGESNQCGVIVSVRELQETHFNLVRIAAPSRY